MIRTLLATTALATLIATGAYAQTATTPAPAETPAVQAPAVAVQRAEGSLVTNIIGESVYNGIADNAENIGKVSDVVFDKDGQAKSVVIGVGGFLGVGAKNVAFDYSKLQWVEKNGDRWLVAPTTKEQLTAQAEFDAKPYAPAPAAPAASTDTTAPAAGTGTAQAPTAEPVKRAEGNLATNIVGQKVYNGTSDDAQNIGSVNDIVLAKDGKADSLVIGVGGFLGLGAKNVAYDFGKAQWAEKNGERWLVAQTTKEELQAQPDFNRKAYDPAPATTASNDVIAPAPMAAVPSDSSAPAVAPADKTAQAPAATAPDATAPDQTQTAAIDKSALTEMPIGEIRGDDLKGTTVYGANDAKVGEIGDVVLTPDSKPDAVVIDVGGFLGIDEKEVAVGMDNLKFMTDKDGKKYLYTTFTKEQLEAQAAYDKSSYTQNRDKQRLTIMQ
jgi:sporulation protein YlmC with PRC-barrel domain